MLLLSQPRSMWRCVKLLEMRRYITSGSAAPELLPPCQSGTIAIKAPLFSCQHWTFAILQMPKHLGETHTATSFQPHNMDRPLQ